jgi:hypothetical protein
VSSCAFCGKPAGFFHNKHHECAEKHENGRLQITRLILQGLSSPASIGSMGSRIRQVAEQSFISEAERRDLSIAGWPSAVDISLYGGILSDEVEKRLLDLKTSLSLSSGDLLRTDAWDRITKSAVLRDVMNGVIPKQIDRSLPFNFQKTERVVWAFDSVDYLEEKTHRQYVGGSRGVSIRVTKGVYYHVGGFKGRAIDRAERVHEDTGVVGITTKQIYFSGAKKLSEFRIRKSYHSSRLATVWGS